MAPCLRAYQSRPYKSRPFLRLPALFCSLLLSLVKPLEALEFILPHDRPGRWRGSFLAVLSMMLHARLMMSVMRIRMVKRRPGPEHAFPRKRKAAAPER